MPNVESLAARLQLVYGAAPEPPAVESAQTFDEGYEEGLAQGRARALEEQKTQAEAQQAMVDVELFKLAEECKFKYQEWLTSIEAPLAGLAAAIAAKAIGREIQQDPESIQSWVRLALAEITDETKATVRLSPSWSAANAVENPAIEFIADPTITAGCVIETEHGMIDARVESMLAEALSALREAA